MESYCARSPRSSAMRVCHPLRVSDDAQPASEMAKADDAGLAVIPASVFDLERVARKHQRRVFKIQSPRFERALPLGWIVADLMD